MDDPGATISELKRSLTKELSSIFSTGEAYSVSRLILEYLGYPELSILKDPSIPISCKIHAEIKKIVGELRMNRPIQYILGETEFYGLKIKVNEHVLIPRQETEELVAHIINEPYLEKPVILDIGTGSGCIAISLASNIADATTFGLDVSSEALSLACENARLSGTLVSFIHESIFDFTALPDKRNVDILVSNPPYVRRSERQYMMPRVTEYEPDIALYVDDNDALVFYRELIRIAGIVLSNRGAIWVEINEALGSETSRLFQESGFSRTFLHKDIHGKDRFIKASR